MDSSPEVEVFPFSTRVSLCELTGIQVYQRVEAAVNELLSIAERYDAGDGPDPEQYVCGYDAMQTS